MAGSVWGGKRRRAAARGLLAALASLTVSAASATTATARHRPKPSRGASFYVGAAKADVTPSSLVNFYLGGYGIGPVHEAKAVLRHIYFRVIAIRDRAGHELVIGALDSQGYSIAYQQGPYGFSDIEQDIQRKLGVAPGHIILQATHSHNGPDEIGIWGGVPTSYFAFLKAQIEAAITRAVWHQAAAHLHLATAEMSGFAHTFGSNTDSSKTGDQVHYPIDQQLRVLQAVSSRSGRVIATLVNYSTHPTVYGPLDKVSPDWPGATATCLEHDEQDMPARTKYGYPGSTAVVTIGAVGHSWPAGIPRADSPKLNPSPKRDDNYPADRYGNAVARIAIGALAGDRGFWLRHSVIRGTERRVDVLNTNPVLLAAVNEPANSTPLGGYKVGRANSAPWAYGDVFASRVTALRLDDLALFSVPGEPYPSVKFSLDHDVVARVNFIFGLAQDQLGYAQEPADYLGALQCSTTDEWFFTISPTFGADVVNLQRANARTLGFGVTGSDQSAYGPGPLPPALNCTLEQFNQLGLPAG